MKPGLCFGTSTSTGCETTRCLRPCSDLCGSSEERARAGPRRGRYSLRSCASARSRNEFPQLRSSWTLIGLGADNPRGVPQMAGRESRERPASGAARDYRLKRFELKTENRSRNTGSGQRFIASNGDSRHPTGGVERDAPHRARPPLIKPYVQISRIRLPV